MKEFFKRLLVGVLAMAMIVGSVVVPTPMNAYAKEKAAKEYEIYPKPQDISYQDGEFALGSEVNAVFESGIDEATQNRLKEAAALKDLKVNVADKKADGKTNILVGVYGSGEYVDKYVQDKYEVKESVFGHFGGHYVIAKDGEICVLGKDTDAAFYGLTSLKHIFNQTEDTIRNFTIADYANTNIRGFIEGYYGIPWSNEDRMSLMQFGGDFKMTSYVFAPKDDPYHSAKWRELYPDEKLAEIAEMAKVGNESKCKFVWTIHPFMHSGITEATYDADIATIKAKFEQLYKVGVRQFGVLGDDAGNLPRSVVIRVMNDLQQWVESKGDVYNLVFCPAGYNDAWQGNYSELNDYDAGFAKDIQIFWTGQAVCQPIEQKTLDNFRRKGRADGEADRRAPLFWLNWPVNDINMSRLMMGKGSLLHTDITIDDLAGAVTNPMQDAQASKVALFAVADYTWNIKGFNDDKSWADSFKYIDKDAAEALHTLAKHMSDPSPNNHGLVLAESEELKPLLDDFLQTYEAGTYDADKAAALVKEFEIIKKACDDFHALSQNEELKAELLPFTDALRDFADAAIGFIATAASLENGTADEVWSNYSEAMAKLTAAKNHDRKTIDGTKKALPAAKRITPFIEKLNALVSVPVNSIIDESKIITSFITNRNDTPDGALEKLTDNKEGTEVIWKNPNSTTAGTYIGLSYSKPITLNDVTFKMGQSGNPKDTFISAKLQYTEDGAEWKDIEGSAYDDRRELVTAEGLDLQVKGVRLISTADQGNMWLGCKDIIVNKNAVEKPEAPEFKMEVIRPQAADGWKVYSGSDANVIDGDDETGVHYSVRSGGNPSDSMIAGDYIGVKFSEAITLGTIHIVQDAKADYIKDGTLQYSLDGTTWTDIQNCNTSAIDVDVSEENIRAQYVRLRQNAEQNNWLKIFEFGVSAKTDGFNGKVYTNVDAYKEWKANYGEDNAAVAPAKDVVLAKDEYIGLKLDRIKDITKIAVEVPEGLTLQTSKNAVVWEDVKANAKADYADARYIRLVNKGDADVTFDLETFAVESFEIHPISIADGNIGFYDSDGMEAFDNDRTTEVIWFASQVEGTFLTYDLGQVIDLDSIALVSKDSAGDFPRHAKISVSEDGQTWKDVMFIGNQDKENEGELEGTDNIMDVLPIHDVSSNLKREEGLNTKARFIKLETTRTKVGPDKWTRYTEIELNGGNIYLPSENNPTIVTDAQESKGNTKSNMIDGEVSTTFRPVGEKAGAFTWYISENTEIGKVRLLQSPSTISNAKVSAEVVKNGKVTEVELGALDKSLVEFDTNVYDHVLSVKVEWTEGNVPEIHEIITQKRVDSTENDAKRLVADIEELLNGNFTAASKAALQAILDKIDTATITAEELEKIKAEVEAAKEELVELGDATELQALIDECRVMDLDAYTEESKKALSDALTFAEGIIASGNATQKDIDDAKKSVEDAKAALELLPKDTAILEEMIAEAEAYKAELDKYTPDTRKAFEAALKEAEDVLADENATQAQIKDAATKLRLAIFELRLIPNKEALKDLIKDAEKVDTSKYTEQSVKAFRAALAEAKAVVEDENATEGDVKRVTKALAAAKENLVAKSEEGKKPADKNEKPATGNSNTTKPSAGADNAAKPTTNNQAKAATTGDSAMTTTLVVVLIVAAAGIVLLFVKRRKSNK